jgi:hypothetical protein
MAETTNFKFRYPIEADSPDIPRDMENLAKDIDKLLFERLFTKVTHAANFGAVIGEMAQFVTNAAVVGTLPAVAANSIIGFINASPGECKVKTNTAGVKIIADGVSVEEIKLSIGQHVVLFCDGANWYIIAGEPRRKTGYKEVFMTKAEGEAGVILSPNRPVHMMTEEGGAMEPKADGELIIPGELGKGAGWFLDPGQTFSMKTALAARHFWVKIF